MGWVRRLRSTILGSSVSAEFDEEARFHLEQRIDEYVKSGMTVDEARREAVRRLGSVMLAREQTRDVDTLRWLTDIGQDARYAMRTLRKNPGFATVAILTLALGIGGNTAMFSVLNTTMLRLLPYPRSEQLVRVWRTSKESRSWPHSTANFLDYRRRNDVFEHLAAFTWITPTWVEPGQPAERLQGLGVTADFFSALGAQAAFGRVFTAEDDQPGANTVAVLADRFWRTRFGGDPTIVGRRLRIDGDDVEIVGVMPPGFEHPVFWGTVDLWRPLPFTAAQQQNRGNNYLQAFGVLKDGVSLSQAQQAMVALAANLSKDTASNQNESLRLEPLHRSQTDDIGRSVIGLTFGLAGFVLLIACANLANLQLLRAAARTRDYAIRAAIGAGRFRLIRQSLTESLVVAALGGVLSVAVAVGIVEFINRRLFGGVPGAAVALDVRVFGFALFCSALTGVIFGTVPAWVVARASLNEGVRDARLGVATRSRRVRQALIVAEIAFALVLLTGAGLFLRGLQRVANDDLGWQPDGLLMANVELQGASYTTPAQRLAFYSVLEERLRAVPGVQRVALARSGPPVWGINNGGYVAIDGRPEPPPGQYPNFSFEPVSLHYFDTLEIRLLAGRTFNTGDTEEHVPVAIVSETLARQVWPNESAIGKRFARVALIRNPPPRVWLEVVGVVNDVAFPGSLGTQPNWRLQVFRPMAQMPAWPPRVNLNFDIIVRAAGNPEALGATMRRAVAELDPTLPLTGISAVRSQIDRSLGGISLLATLLGAFAALGLILAAIGIYGVTSYAVVQRTQEFGLRIALGAQPGDVLRLILAQSARLTVYGTLLGVGGAYAVARLLMATIPTVPTRDPLLAFGLMLALAAVAMIASYSPAKRATLIDPLVALRHE